MRLTCPECDAQYQVEDALIPPEGRSVECARCGHLWHQPGRMTEAFVLGDADLAPEVIARQDPSDDDRPRTSAKALEVLREEAAREMAHRNADRARAEARLADRAGSDSAGSDRWGAATSGSDPSRSEPSKLQPSGVEPSGADAQPELVVAELVDDDEAPYAASAHAADDDTIASLEWRELPDDAPDHPDSFAAERAPPLPHRSRLGYRAGFGVAVGAAVLAVALYAAAPASAGLGLAERSLALYRDGVDQLRWQLRDFASPVLGDR